jgi:hypothetical protein
VISNTTIITQGAALPIILSIGVIYDTFGRKKPYGLAIFLVGVSYILYPICTEVWFYYLITFLGVLFNATSNLPFIPDLI